jgi:hypothetical protein
MNHKIFHDYLKDVLLPHIEQAKAEKGGPAVLLRDNCSSYRKDETIQMLSEQDFKVVQFPPHTSGIFQMLDLSFFGTFTRAKQSFSKNPELHFMADHADRMYRVFDAARTTSTVRGAFMHVGITYTKHGFKEVWHANFLIAQLSPRRLSARWGFINSDHFPSKRSSMNVVHYYLRVYEQFYRHRWSL